MKKSTLVTILIIIIVIIGVGFYLFIKDSSPATEKPSATQTATTSPNNTQNQNQTPSTQNTNNNPAQTVIGTSVQGRDITAYNFGNGSNHIVFVGGIHGGYEWNTALVAYKLMDYLKANPSVIPANVEVSVIPVLNPDGLNKVVGTTTGNFTQPKVSASELISGRFNANNVDLNRNFDCDWQATGTWQNTPVSGGSAAFSEPESLAMKNYIEATKPAAVIVWYSAAGGVYASNCHNGVSPQTDALTKTYAKASGYPAHQSFDFYVTTGDMTNWLAKSGIPAISILLTNHTNTDWSKNLAGIQAVLNSYAQ